MDQIATEDPAYKAAIALEESLAAKSWTGLPEVRKTPHFWQAELPLNLEPGTYQIEVRAIEESGKPKFGRRLIRVR